MSWRVDPLARGFRTEVFGYLNIDYDSGLGILTMSGVGEER